MDPEEEIAWSGQSHLPFSALPSGHLFMSQPHPDVLQALRAEAGARAAPKKSSGAGALVGGILGAALTPLLPGIGTAAGIGLGYGAGSQIGKGIEDLI